MIGIDVGGTNLRAAHIGGEAIREVIGEPRDPAAVVERVASVVERLAPDGPVGVGIAAMLADRRGTVANSPHL